jgi:hypothetical protein
MSQASKNLLKGTLKNFKLHPRVYPGLLGDDLGRVKVSGRPNYVYVRVPGQPVSQVFNNRVSPELDLPVMVGYTDDEPNKFQVVSMRRAFGKFGGTNEETVLVSPAHHQQHEWMAVGGGDDVVFTQLRQFMPLRPTAMGGMLVNVYRNIQFVNNQWMGVSGQDFDLTDAIPYTGTYFGLIYVDTDGTLDMLTGTLRNFKTLGINDIPKPIPNTYPVAAVRLYGGQTGVFESRQNTDIVDLRMFNVPIQATGSGGGHIIYDEGVMLPTEPKMNFTGQFVTASDDPTNAQTVVRVDDTRWEDINRMGFAITPESTLSFDPATYTLTLAKIGANWSYFRRGRKNIITANKTCVLAGSPPAKGTYFIYIDDDIGTLSQMTTPWTLADTKVPVAIVEWDNALTPKYQLMDERHTVAIDRRMHQFIHESEGCHYVSGGVPTGTVISTDSNAAICYGISPCVIDDEDLKWTLSAIDDPTGATGTYTAYYRNGAGIYNWKTSNMPYSYHTGGYIDWDSGGTLTEGQHNKYYNEYLIATNLQGQARFIIMPGRGEFASLAAAQAESPFNFDWTGFSIPEVVILYQFTYQTQNSNTDTGKVQLAALPKRIITSVVSISSTGGGIDGHVIINESNVPMTQRGNLAFAGSVAVTDDAGNNQTLVTISVTGTVPGHTIEEEGTPLTTRPKLNFKGANVWAQDNAGDNATDVIISGSSAGGTLGGAGASPQVAFWKDPTTLDGNGEFTHVTGTVDVHKLVKSGGFYNRMMSDPSTVVLVESGYCWIVSSEYEIASGTTLEIASGAVMEVI